MTTTAKLHDGSDLEVTVLGEGPAVLLPVSLAVVDEATAEQMRAWGAQPDLGPALAHGLADAGHRVIVADYEGHRAAHPAGPTLTADAVATDLLAIADAAGAHEFAYYGYSWLALSGLQLAIRTDRLTGLAMGGFPPLGGPYGPMLAVTRAAHRMATENAGRVRPDQSEIEPGDWDAAVVTQTPEQTRQYVTLYESLRDFDERAALDGLKIPRLAFAGQDDAIDYGPQWGNVRVELGPPLAHHRAELEQQGWTVEVVPGDHMTAMRTTTALPILTTWLTTLGPGR
ncbi:alpha/beta hydrolase [Actinoplanes sp. NPDC089786]|uniref:alpha/beta fold hydrolase n=1 Tax=Actinoplanes sp. NPDC089786 TaxID=3155185 RepID=UPI0034291B32